MNKSHNYTFYHLINIRFADPVSAIGLNEKYVVIGSMMGRIASFSLQDKKSTLLAELSSENITGITFEAIDTFNIAVGDEEILKYKFTTNHAGQIVPDYMRLKNYESENTHKNRCDSCFTLLSTNHCTLIFMNQPNENNMNIAMQTTSIKVKNIQTNSSEDFMVEMTNYSVPFDFDGFRLTWVEFLSESERNICIYYPEKNIKWTHQINKEFGHISHMKLMPNNKLFLVRNLNICEIRDVEKDFKIVQKFIHLGDEVLAVDFYVNSSKILINDMELDNIHVSKNKDEQYIKIPIDRKNDNEIVAIEDNYNNFNEENISIFLLDIDGNLNVWENFSVTTFFNLYDLKDIDEDFKNKQFFSMGYPYFIKANLNYFAISSDHGVFVIKRGNE